MGKAGGQHSGPYPVTLEVSHIHAFWGADNAHTSLIALRFIVFLGHVIISSHSCGFMP